MKPTMPPVFAEKDLNYYLRMIRGDFGETEETPQMARSATSAKQKNIVVMISSLGMGQGQPELSQRLLKFFVQALVHNSVKPRAVILINEAVKLACAESPILTDLDLLTQQGVRVMVDVVSADEYKVEQDLKVGSIADMDNICDFMLTAWKVISL